MNTNRKQLTGGWSALDPFCIICIKISCSWLGVPTQPDRPARFGRCSKRADELGSDGEARTPQPNRTLGDKADPYDNAMMESFFGTLRAELTDLEHFSTRNSARKAVFEFIEVFFNRQRLHSALGYRSPATFGVANSS